MSDESSTQSNQSQLSPDTQKLQDSINAAFAQLGEVFRTLAQPRYTMDEIDAAMTAAGAWRYVSLTEKELTRARSPKL